MKRIYDSMLRDHLATLRQMAFVSGPRQVGKTTTCRGQGDVYFDWDVQAHQRTIVAGQNAAAEESGLDALTEGDRPVIVFDELHKYPRWKNFLKGFFDLYADACRIVVTGSSRLDTYRRGGDSLVGRYFLVHMHPLSVAELLTAELPAEERVLRPPSRLDADAWESLWQYGGFPEPMIAGNSRFMRRWQTQRHTQLFKEDLRDLTRIQDLALLEVMGRFLEDRSGRQIVVSNLARDVQVAPNTAKLWVNALCALHFGFLVKPWHRNVSKSLRKNPKWYLRDWSSISDRGQRAETLVACHLLKAVEGWTDLGLGNFDLRYLRDKEKREVDFAVIRDEQVWFLVEVKTGSRGISPSLPYFQSQTGARHAFQLSMDMEYVDKDCFSITRPVCVPALTLLSQLL
jgi:predicted AAA+ superfamily ATPase